MTVPTIQNGRTQFFPILYEGNGGGQRVGKFVPFTDNGTIANSCVFDDGSNEYLNRTPGSASNRRTFTFSCWIKLGAGTIDSGAEKAIFSARDGSSDNYSILSINGDQSGANQLEFISVISIMGTYGFNLFCILVFTCPAILFIKNRNRAIAFNISIFFTVILILIYGLMYKKNLIM